MPAIIHPDRKKPQIVPLPERHAIGEVAHGSPEALAACREALASGAAAAKLPAVRLCYANPH